MTSRQEEQAERKSLVGSDQATTYHKLGNLDLSLGGRFAAGGDVSGAEEATHYPRQPESSPWSHDPVPPEPALGFSVEEVEPCGTPAEIAASLAQSAGGEDAAGALASSLQRALLSLMEAKR
jgi:hypothetical protein